jgi:HSP20 family protein
LNLVHLDHINNKMPFFQPAYLSPEAQFFSTLLSSLDDQPQRKSCGPRQARVPTFTPRFDITESTNAYELYGEVPGIEQADILIEFSDAQTVVIKGKTERLNTSAAAPAAETESESEKHNDNDAASEKSHNPTVEDEYDEADTPLATPATTATAVATTTAQETAAPVEAPKPKFWVQERKVGEFARSFSFAQRIEQDGVTAALKNGILHIVVPKSQKARKVAVSVN